MCIHSMWLGFLKMMKLSPLGSLSFWPWVAFSDVMGLDITRDSPYAFCPHAKKTPNTSFVSPQTVSLTCFLALTGISKESAF